MTRIVITGMGAVTPHGDGLPVLWAGWTGGEVPFEDGVAPCARFDPAAHFSRKEMRRSDRYSQLALVAAREALEQAAWEERPPTDPGRTGCVWGSQHGGLASFEQAILATADPGNQRVSTFALPNMIPNSAAALASMRWQLRGPTLAVSVACATGGQAIASAAAMLRADFADAMLVGAAEATLTELGRRLSRAQEAVSSSGRLLAFDARRDGFVPAEGAGALVLETEEHAAARGASVLGVLRGVGMASDAFHLTAPHDQGRGCAEALRLALADAGLGPEDVDYVNAHGTGTVLNDLSEVRALKHALGEHAHRVPVSSTKTSTGHLIGAAGVVETAATVEALNRRTAPPTLSLEVPDPELDLDFVAAGPRPLEVPLDRPAVALKCSAGFGGHNVVLCLEGAA